jgi:hypothetical protein
MRLRIKFFIHILFVISTPFYPKSKNQRSLVGMPHARPEILVQIISIFYRAESPPPQRGFNAS